MCALAVIIPTYNEQAYIDRAIVSAQGADEIIVADGGSTDDTTDIARAHGAGVITSPRGRAAQMNAGAKAAQSDTLLFLHADTELPPGFSETVAETLAQPAASAGAFRFAVPNGGLGLRWIAWTVNLRSRHLQMPYGDQALFMRAQTFQACGGYPEIPIMEDVALVRALRRHGRVALAGSAVRISARSWARHGVVLSTARNTLALTQYLLGASPVRIATWYHDAASPRSAPKKDRD